MCVPCKPHTPFKPLLPPAAPARPTLTGLSTPPHNLRTLPLPAVTGHGVPQPAISRALDALTQFFALPPASKQALAHNSHAKGYMAWGQQTLDLAGQSCGDTKETWAVMGEGQRQRVTG